MIRRTTLIVKQSRRLNRALCRLILNRSNCFFLTQLRHILHLHILLILVSDLHICLLLVLDLHQVLLITAGLHHHVHHLG